MSDPAYFETRMTLRSETSTSIQYVADKADAAVKVVWVLKEPFGEADAPKEIILTVTPA